MKHEYENVMKAEKIEKSAFHRDDMIGSFIFHSVLPTCVGQTAKIGSLLINQVLKQPGEINSKTRIDLT